MESYFNSLPSDIQNALTDTHLQEQISEICDRNGVAGSCELITKETTATLMGVQPIKGFVSRLAAQAKIAAPVAQKIADEINENIFRAVRQSLILIHEIPQNEQAQIPAVEQHFEHLIENHTPAKIALSRPAAPAPKTLAEQKMSRPTSLPPQISRNEPDPYRESIE